MVHPGPVPLLLLVLTRLMWKYNKYIPALPSTAQPSQPLPAWILITSHGNVMANTN